MRKNCEAGGKTAVFEIEPDGAVIEEYKQDRCVSQIVKICGGGTKILYERGCDMITIALPKGD